jgi:hypothetical protein
MKAQGLIAGADLTKVRETVPKRTVYPLYKPTKKVYT